MSRAPPRTTGEKEEHVAMVWRIGLRHLAALAGLVACSATPQLTTDGGGGPGTAPEAGGLDGTASTDGGTGGPSDAKPALTDAGPYDDASTVSCTYTRTIDLRC